MAPPNPSPEDRPADQPAAPASAGPATPPKPGKARPPIFREPEASDRTTAPPPPGSTPAPDQPGEGSETASPTGGPEKGRPGSRSRGRTDQHALVEPIKGGVLVATSMANEFLTRDEDERELGVYIADEDDADNIARPASRMLTRRMRDDGVMNPDLADAIAALVALANYISKVFRRRAQVRQARAGMPQQPDAEPAAA